MALTPLAISSLALLAERPMHPYEMYQLLLERHEDRVVKVRPGSLYHTIERLQANHLVESTGTDRDGNRPERTTYAITASGRAALVGRIREVLQRPVREYPIFPLALSEAHNIGAEHVIADLTHYLGELDADIEDLRAAIDCARADNIAEVYWVTGSYLLTTSLAQREWLATLITRIQTEDLTWQPHLQ